MSNFSSLKAAIQLYIKTNGNEEITGAVLQDILLSMVSVLGDTAINDLETALQTETMNRTRDDGELSGRMTTVQNAITTINTKLAEGYVYAGIATTSTNPGVPSGKVFYVATAAGTYTHFGNITVESGINILKYNGESWVKEYIEDTSVDKFFPVKQNGHDLIIIDNNNKAVVIFSGGDLRTKNFNSADIILDRTANPDFCVLDSYNKEVLSVNKGHIRTKNFNSADLPEFRFDGLKISILGDSISTFNGTLVPNNIGLWSYYPKGDVQSFVDTYWGKLIAEDGAVLEANCASNGSLVSGSSALAFCSDERLELLGDPDVIFVYGGTNDISQPVPVGVFNYDGDYSGKTDYFKPAYAYCLYKMKTLYPSAKIVCFTLPDFSGAVNAGHESDYPIKNGAVSMMEYNECIKELANAYNCAICEIGDVLPYFDRQSFYIQDQDNSLVHPNKEGMSRIYKKLKKLLLGIV